MRRSFLSRTTSWAVRVTPGRLPTCTALALFRLLISELLPTFGNPTIPATHLTVSWKLSHSVARPGSASHALASLVLFRGDQIALAHMWQVGHTCIVSHCKLQDSRLLSSMPWAGLVVFRSAALLSFLLSFTYIQQALALIQRAQHTSKINLCRGSHSVAMHSFVPRQALSGSRSVTCPRMQRYR